MTTRDQNREKRRSHLGIGIVLCAVVFLVSTSATAYAAWQVVDKAKDTVSTTGISVVLIEEPKTTTPVFPGDDITQHLYAKNTGVEDAFVRVQVKAQFVKRSNGQIIEALPDTDGWIEVVYNKINWKDGGDGYMYLRGVLTPDTTSASLISSITLSPSANSRVAGYEVHLTTKLEALQNTAGAVSAQWNKSYEFMESSQPDPKPDAHASITFTNPTAGFVFDPASKNLITNASGLTPGEVVVNTIALVNEYSEVVDITIASGDFAQDAKTALLSEYAILTIANENGTIIFEGPAAGKEWEAFAYTTKLAPHSSTRWTISLTIDPQAGNEVQNVSVSSLTWQVMASGTSPEPPKPNPDPSPNPSDSSDVVKRIAKTNDLQGVYVWTALALSSAVVLLVLVRARKSLARGGES